ESKSRQLWRNSERLLERYGGSLQRMHDGASSPEDLAARGRACYRVGPVTANIFLRARRTYRKRAAPDPSPRVRARAAARGVDPDRIPRKSLRFARAEAGLVRLLIRHPKGKGAPRSKDDFLRLVRQGVAEGAPSMIETADM